MKFDKKISFSDVIKKKIPGIQLGVLEVIDFNITKNPETVQLAYHNLFSYIENKFAENPPSSDQTVSAVRHLRPFILILFSVNT